MATRCLAITKIGNQCKIKRNGKLFCTRHNKSNPSDIYSYSTKESPIYRGTKINPADIPGVGETFSFDRFRSFTPDIHIAGPFTKGYKPFDVSDPNSFHRTDSNKVKTLF